MKTIVSAVIFSVALTCAALAHAATAQSDQAEIEQAIENWNKAWVVKDPKLAAQNYSEDADWTNAFGMARKGRADIEKVLTEVFALPFVMAGESKTVDQSIRFVKPDLALVTTRVERAGQRGPAGEDIGLRRTTHLRVFSKSEGTWTIISHLISDSRDTEKPAR